jgi:Ca2+-transporting ATPase
MSASSPHTTPTGARETRRPHSLSIREVLRAQETSREGLTSEQARQRLDASGPNELPTGPPLRLAIVILRQLKSPLIYVLLAAAAVSLAMGHVSDAAFIGVVLLVNSAIGTWQEWTAERESAALKRMIELHATVIRDGVRREIASAQVVPGDVVTLESGQRIPADLRLIDALGLEVDESLLTGESMAVSKDAGWTGDESTVLADRRNMTYAGSSVTRGRALGVVVATGAQTELGRIATAMSTTEGGKPPLVTRMERFSRIIALAVVAAAVAIGAAAVLIHGRGIAEMFVFGVALAVAAVPEGLPVALSVALAIAARRMAQRGAIVRQLPAVEGLGSCTLIATDKTGTLTCNELTVREILLPGRTRYQVTGAGYVPAGDIQGRDGPVGYDDDAGLANLLDVAVSCNEGGLLCKDGEWMTRGDPTDIALLVVALKAGADVERIRKRLPQMGTIPFESERRFAATFHARLDRTWVAVKGAPERVLEMCDVMPEQGRRISEAADQMAQAGRRVLAFASGYTATRVPFDAPPTAPSGLEFAGLVGLIDPLRPGAREAVAACHAAGIAVKIVTGDHPATALAIAGEVGVTVDAQAVMDGNSLADVSSRMLPDVVDRTAVFARVTPQQKLAIVEAAQRRGHFVAVTGDGVNDAPALRRANIGVAMGRSGTDVARDASDLVITDDDFATIVAGVQQGRIAYSNVRNEVYLLIAAGIAEVATIGIAVVAGLPMPLLPVQILWLNVVTNGIQDVALAFEKGHGDELGRPPRRPDEPLIDRVMLSRGLLAGTWMAVAGLATYVGLLHAGVPIDVARNELLLLMTLMQNVDAFNARSERRSVLTIPLSSNPVLAVGVPAAVAVHVFAMYAPVLQDVLRTAPVTASAWFTYLALAASLMLAMELQKLWLNRRRRDATRVSRPRGS